MLKLDNICKTYRTTEVETLALDNVSMAVDAWRVRRDHGAVGLRQVHFAQHPGSAR